MFGERHSSELTRKRSGENGHKGPFTRSKFSIKNLVKFLTEFLLKERYPVYTIKIWSKIDQSFYPKLPFGGKFKDKQ